MRVLLAVVLLLVCSSFAVAKTPHMRIQQTVTRYSSTYHTPTYNYFRFNRYQYPAINQIRFGPHYNIQPYRITPRVYYYHAHYGFHHYR